MTQLRDAPYAPVGLLYLATFSAAEREAIARSPLLITALRAASPAEWPEILEQHRRAYRPPIPSSGVSLDGDGIRRQALHDLQEAAEAYGLLTDGRRVELYRLVCRLAKYVSHRVISRHELEASLGHAAERNGAIAKHGHLWFKSTIARGLAAGQNDGLPPLSSRFRTWRRP